MNKYTLNEVSKLFNIPKPTLRYWEEEKLIFSHRNDCNEYRLYTSEDLIIIADIIFYRSLNIPIKSLKNIYQLTLQENADLLKKSQIALEQELNRILEIQLKLKKRMNAIDTYINKTNFGKIQKPPFKRITHLHLSNQENVQTYLEDQTRLAIVIQRDTGHIDEFGLTTDTLDSNQTYLWEYKRNSTYISGIIKLREQNIDLTDIYPIFEFIESQGKHVGQIIGHYLTPENIDDYYQVWIEVIERK